MAWVALVAALGAGSAARAADVTSLRDFLFPHHDQAAGLAPGRYLPAEGEAFVVDRGNVDEILLRFDDDPEVWALHAAPGPRGDVIYKNDVGEPVLRATRLGGLTLFTSRRPGGAPTAVVGEGPAIHMPGVPTANALFQILIQSSVRASRAAQHLVVFEAPDLSPHDVTPASSAVIADAAWITAEAFAHMASRGLVGRTQVARFSRVQFTTGRDVQAQTSGAVMVITVAPERGYAGRPSSAKVQTALSRK